MKGLENCDLKSNAKLIHGAHESGPAAEPPTFPGV